MYFGAPKYNPVSPLKFTGTEESPKRGSQKNNETFLLGGKDSPLETGAEHRVGRREVVVKWKKKKKKVEEKESQVGGKPFHDVYDFPYRVLTFFVLIYLKSERRIT